MDLWIRSQDKLNLVNGTQIKIEFSDDYNKTTNSYRSWLIKDGEIKLGKYKSKERALEVLDEIQNIIYFNRLADLDLEIFSKCLDEDMKLAINKQNELLRQMSVYEMPQE